MPPNMRSGNNLVDKEDDAEEYDEEYCSDCKSSPCRCDDLYERNCDK